MRWMDWTHRIALVALVAVLAVTPGLSVDTGTLVVKAQDRAGGAFPGVVVEILSSRGLAVPAPGRTDPTGSASFALPPGTGYTVKVTLAGYDPQQLDFDIGAGETRRVLFTMHDSLVESLKVTAPIVSLDEGKGSTKFSHEFIEDLPNKGRTYEGTLTLAPGVTDPDGDGNPNVHGSRSRDVHLAVDGVSIVDPLTGRFMSEVNPDAIDEIEMITTGATAEFGGASGAFARITTKSGGNTFDGDVSLYVRSSFFDGGSVNSGTDAQDPVYHDVRPTLNVTGPVVKNRLFFALFHEYIDIGTPVALLSGSSIVQSQYGSRNLDKLTWQVSPRNTIAFQAQADPIRISNAGVASNTDPRSGYSLKLGGPTYQVHWDAQIGSGMIVQSLVGFSRTGTSRIPTTIGTKNACGVDLESRTVPSSRRDPFGSLETPQPLDEDYCLATIGARTSGSYWNDTDDDRTRYSVKSDASYHVSDFLGVSHTLKAGILAERKAYEQTLMRHTVTTFDEALVSFTGSLSGAFEPGGGSLNRTLWTPGFPHQARRDGEGSSYAAYIEDQFRPRRNWSVTAGMRVEQENIRADGFERFDPATEAAQFDAGYAACMGSSSDPGTSARCARANFHYFHTFESFPVLGGSPIRQYVEDPTVGLQRRVPERFRISNTTLSPRLSVSWDPGADGKTKIFGTAGRYYGETFLAVPLFEQPPTAFNVVYDVDPLRVDQPNPGGDGTITTFIPVIEPDTQADVQPATVYQVDRNLRPAYQDEYTLGFQREILPETSVTVTYIRRYFRDLFQDIDANHFARDLGTVTATSGCFRPRPQSALQPIDPRKDGVFDDCGGRIVVLPGIPPLGTARRIEVPDGVPDLFINNPFFNQVFRVGNYNASDYKAYEVELKRRLHRNWELDASYVWSKATGAAEDFAQALGDDPSNVDDEKGYLSFDQRHVVKVNVATQLPLWNLRMSSAFIWQSGLPFSIIEEHFSNDQLKAFGTTNIQYGQTRTTYPTHQRNDQRNAGSWNFDMGIRKDFSVGKSNIEASVDVFNLFNDNAVEFQQQKNNQTIGQIHIGRQYQVGAKLTF